MLPFAVTSTSFLRVDFAVIFSTFRFSGGTQRRPLQPVVNLRVFTDFIVASSAVFNP
jgi:hypothetical protein